MTSPEPPSRRIRLGWPRAREIKFSKAAKARVGGAGSMDLDGLVKCLPQIVDSERSCPICLKSDFAASSSCSYCSKRVCNDCASPCQKCTLPICQFCDAGIRCRAPIVGRSVCPPCLEKVISATHEQTNDDAMDCDD